MNQNHLPETLLVDCSEEVWPFRIAISNAFEDAVPVLEAAVEAVSELTNIKQNVHLMIQRLGDELLDLGEKNLQEQLKVSYMLNLTVERLLGKFTSMNMYADNRLLYKLRTVRNDYTLVFALPQTPS